MIKQMKVSFGLVELCQTNMVHEGLYVLGKGSYYTRAVRLHSMQLIPIYYFYVHSYNIFIYKFELYLLQQAAWPNTMHWNL